MTWIASLLPAAPLSGPRGHDPAPPTADDHERLALALGLYVKHITSRALRLVSQKEPGLLKSKGLSVTALRRLLIRWCAQDSVRTEFGVEAVRGLQLALEDMPDRELGTLIKGLAESPTTAAPPDVHLESAHPGGTP